jgi:hypothetical protein
MLLSDWHEAHKRDVRETNETCVDTRRAWIRDVRGYETCVDMRRAWIAAYSINCAVC